MSEKTRSVFEQLKDYIQSNNLNIEVELVGTWLWVYGSDTKTHKDFLKSLGMRWGKQKQRWYYHSEPFRKTSKKSFTYEEIQALNGSEKLL